nr:response regulator [uncultured Allomuricauda sp.]
MKCIIVEDQPPAQRILQKYIEDLGYLELKGVFSNAIQAMAYLKSEAVDLLFLDIHLPKLSGIDFLKTIPNPPCVILTTAFSEYALEGYELDVTDYLLKPFSFQRFVKAVSKASDKKRQQPLNLQESTGRDTRKDIYIKSGHEHIKVGVGTIRNISADSDYTEIITNDKKYLSSEPLRLWSDILPKDSFHRIHKSHIINLKMIEKIVGNQVYLVGGVKLPIGRSYKERFMDTILK